MHDDNFILVFLVLAAAIAVFAFFSGLPKPPEVRLAVESAGYSDIVAAAPTIWSLKCGQGEAVATFTAISPRGEPVSGFACCGVFSGCTVRH